MRDACSNICFVGRLIRDFFRRIFVVFVIVCMCGCVNCYTRWPTTDEKITMVYQCSREAAGLSVLVAFPQMMSDVPNGGFMWENIFTIPVGCLCLCDAAVEACIDTVCLPVDWPLAASRKEAK